jgi:hypothetical protein
MDLTNQWADGEDVMHNRGRSDDDAMDGRRFDRNGDRRRKGNNRNYNGVNDPEMAVAGFAERRDDDNRNRRVATAIQIVLDPLQVRASLPDHIV